MYRFERSEIGRQFLIFRASPFFGIKRTTAERKECESSPLLKHVTAYLKSGTRNTGQFCLINLVLRPSCPDADFRLAFLIAVSSSVISNGLSSSAFSVGVNLLFCTIGCSKTDLPRNFSIQPDRSSGSEEGFLYISLKVSTINFSREISSSNSKPLLSQTSLRVELVSVPLIIFRNVGVIFSEFIISKCLNFSNSFFICISHKSLSFFSFSAISVKIGSLDRFASLISRIRVFFSW